jgi:SAM-dependent methyltransferase
MTTSAQKSHVRDFFNSSDGWRGKFYREVHNPFGQMLVRRKYHVLRLFRKHVDHSTATVFDAGCGPGEYLGELGDAGVRVFGMDASEEMLAASGELLRDRGLEGAPPLVRGDLEHVPVKSGSFDAVLCIGVLGYLESDAGALAELHRLLRPGGVLIVNVRNLNAATSLHYSGRLKLNYLRSHGWREFRGLVSMATHTRDGGWKSRAYNLRRFERLIGSTGFTRLEGVTFGYELKALGMLGLGGRQIVRMETWVERLMMAIPLRALRYSGWGYIGVFRKTGGGGSAAPAA